MNCDSTNDNLVDEEFPDGDGDAVRSRARLGGVRGVIQVVGFLVGLGLLGWCIRTAVLGGDLSKLRSASGFQLMMLIVCTLVSVVANGAIFWVLLRATRETIGKRVSFLDIQLVNVVVNFANYAPVRLGVILRFAHHRRVDGLSYVVMTAWYAAMAILLMLVFASIIVATVIRPGADVLWFLILVSVLVVGLIVIRYVASHHLFVARLHGADRMLNHSTTLIVTIVLRLIDLAAFGGRLYYSLSIIGVAVSFRDWLYLILISIVSSLSPVGSLGFREFAISYFGPYLTGSALKGDGLEEQLAAVVLVDRSAEAIVFIPLGIIGVIWMVRKWRKCKERSEEVISE